MTTREAFEEWDQSGDYSDWKNFDGLSRHEQFFLCWQAATDAALAAPAHPERKPMGQFEIEAAYQESQQHHLRPQDFNKVCDMVRAVEAFHGITGGKT